MYYERNQGNNIFWNNSNQAHERFVRKKFKTLKKEIEEDVRRWKDLPHSWISKRNVVKMAILQKAMYKFNVTLTEIPYLHR